MILRRFFVLLITKYPRQQNLFKNGYFEITCTKNDGLLINTAIPAFLLPQSKWELTHPKPNSVQKLAAAVLYVGSLVAKAKKAAAKVNSSW